jgi:3-hydroxyisobutyrate dehydrogenase-like beta-hydroxyacid dehydrogenase
MGGMGASNVVEAIEMNDLILVCMSIYSATRSILDTDKMRQYLIGKTLVQMGTGTPNEARENEKWMTEIGGAYLDVTIDPYPERIGEPESRFFISGSEAAYELALTYLKLFGGDLRYLGENVGAANTLDLGGLIYCLGTYIGFAHAAQVCKAEGVGLDHFASMFEGEEPGRVLSDMVQANNFEVGAIHTGVSIKTWEGCIQLIQDHAKQNNLNSEVPDFYSQLFNRAPKSGYGEEDVAAIVKVLSDK